MGELSMNPTEQAKKRAANLKRRGARPMAPEHRINVNMDPNAIQGAAQGAVQGAGAPAQQQQVQPQEDKPQPRSKGEVNADLHAYGEALKQHNEKEQVEEEPEKKKDDYQDDEYEALWGNNDILNNPARRKRIEARCKPMSLDEYILSGGVKQRVPIVPGKLEITYRTSGVDEDLEVKRLMYGLEGTDVYVSNKFSLMQLTLSLHAMNGEVLPNHLDTSGKFDEDAFNKKFSRISKYPTQLTEDLVNNYLWFDERVKNLLNEDLGNG